MARQYDEKSLIADLKTLSDLGCVAFAAAAATRQICSWERAATGVRRKSRSHPREILDRIWDDLLKESIDLGEWQALLRRVEKLLIDADDIPSIGGAWADDAIASVGYAIRSGLGEKAQEAAWAARRATEAAYSAATRVLKPKIIRPEDIPTIVSHSFVQRELGRQADDLQSLRQGKIDEVRLRAFRDEILTAEEVKRIG
jgi:hypothetical protein